MPYSYDKLKYLYDLKCVQFRKEQGKNRTLSYEIKAVRKDIQKFTDAIDRAIKESPLPEIRWQVFINEVIKHDGTETYVQEYENR